MVSLIVAHADQNVIGFKGSMPWHLPDDLKHVKRLTEGNTIVMGRKTYDSIGRPLPNRRNVVMTRDKNFTAEGVDIIHSVDEIKSLDGKVFIFGGSNIYKETMHLVDEMYVTRIYETFGGDTFFPEYDIGEWTVSDRETGEVNMRNKYPHEFIHYVRKTQS